MIFVTVGSQTPFDRLIQAVDAWASATAQPQEVVAQIGSGGYVPRHIHWVRSLSPSAFRQHCREAHAIVAHAGMGSVLTALEFAKPMLLMPRRAALRETRNDHQLATARWLATRPGIWIAEDAQALAAHLPALLHATVGAAQAPVAPAAFTDALRRYIDGG